MESTNSGSRKEKSVSLRLVGLKRFVLFCCLLNCLFYFLFRSRIHVFLFIIIIVIIIIIIILSISLLLLLFFFVFLAVERNFWILEVDSFFFYWNEMFFNSKTIFLSFN